MAEHHAPHPLEFRRMMVMELVHKHNVAQDPIVVCIAGAPHVPQEEYAGEVE